MNRFQVISMETSKATNLIKFYNEGMKRIRKLMQQRNFDHAFVIVDLLQQQTLSEYENLRANVKSYCEIYPDETWALEFTNHKQRSLEAFTTKNSGTRAV